MTSVVEISLLTRVEGHGSVKVFLDGKRVERVELALTDSPRLFEALLLGKSYLEVPEIICRICSLCSTVHKVTALLAVEKALGMEVSEVTALTRELIVNGGMIQDHALHLYCLVLPDLVGTSGMAGLARVEPELLKSGLRIKRVGNLIQETVGGRLIHPVNIAVGGLGQRVPADTLRRLREELISILPDCRETYRLFEPPVPWEELPKPLHLALDLPSPAVSSDHLRASNGYVFPVDSYRDHVTESVLPHSNAKHASLPGGEPTVGALSRLNLGSALSREAGDLFRKVEGKIVGSDIRANNLAQAIELLQGVERAVELIERLLAMGGEGGDNVGVKGLGGRGSAACEAPRGVLIHSYAFDHEGLCTDADVITPTSLNQGALSRDLLALATSMEGADEVQLKGALERLVRCYDPCISCSVHLLRL